MPPSSSLPGPRVLAGRALRRVVRPLVGRRHGFVAEAKALRREIADAEARIDSLARAVSDLDDLLGRDPP